MATDLASLIEPVARALLGEPNRHLSSKTELRFGTHGSIAVDLRKGTYYDHENSQGGGTIALIESRTGLHGADCFTWMRDHGLPIEEDDRRNGGSNGTRGLGRVVAVYPYSDENGEPLFEVVRFEPKTFRQRRRARLDDDPSKVHDGYIYSVRGLRAVPYRLPELIEALALDRLVFVVEGEKDADNLVRIGVPATTNAGGVGKWSPKLSKVFSEGDVIIIADNDPQAKTPKGEPRFHADGRPVLPGQDHAQEVAAELFPVARRVRVLDLKEFWPACPDKGDISDWIEAGEGDAARLYEIIEQLPDWAPGLARENAPTGLPPILSKAAFLVRYGKPPDYLVDDLLQRGFIYALTGQTGHAKTAVALLIARLVASADHNATLGNHKVAKGRVLYFVGENPDDVSMRLRGSDAVRDDDPAADNISFVPNIFDIEQMMAVIERDSKTNGEISLVIVDTSAAYFLGNEELSNTQMGAYARTLRKLTTLPGRPCVLVLCHPIKHVTEPMQLLPRGGSAYLNEMDGNLTLWRTGDDVVVLDYTKLRGPAFHPVTFQLKPIRTPKLLDAKGRQISTIEAMVISATEEDAVENRDTNEEDRVLAAMLKIEDGSFTSWATHLGWIDGQGQPYKKRVERIVTRLSAGKPKLVTRNRKNWSLTEEGKTQARKASLRFLREVDAAKQPEMF